MSVSILTADCREALASMESGSVHCIVTSPPYFGLRDYGVAGQIGLEPTPAEFVAELVAVFREARRVLRDDGTLWLNLGDSYAGSRCGPQGRLGEMADRSITSQRVMRAEDGSHVARPGAKPKELLGIPWRVAFALQEDGWYLRQDIIWSKPNPMPESVRDRCTKAHEYLFLLSKQPQYYYDQAAIAEPIALSTVSRLAQDVDAQVGSDRVPGKTNGTMKAKPPRFGGNKYGDSDEGGRTYSGNDYTSATDGKRNRRSVWTVATQPFTDAHFATFPPALIEPCILAGCPVGGTVLDPFGGAGTTGLVASRLQRSAVLIELNPEYAAMARARVSADAPLLEGAA